MQFPKLWVQNNPRQVDMLLKPIYLKNSWLEFIYNDQKGFLRYNLSTIT